MPTLYAVLGLEQSATANEIKKSYHQLSKLYHPDKNQEPGSEEKFKQVLDAYTTLKDAATRREYDLKIGVNTTATAAASSGYASSNGSSRYNQAGYGNDPTASFSRYSQYSTFYGRGNSYTKFQQSRSQEWSWNDQEYDMRKAYQQAHEAYRERARREEKNTAAEDDLEKHRRAKQAREQERKWEQEREKERARLAAMRRQEEIELALFRAKLEREKLIAAQERLARKKRDDLRAENDKLLRMLGYLDADDNVDPNIMRTFKAYSTEFPDEVSRQQALNDELRQIRKDRLLAAQQEAELVARHKAAQEAALREAAAQQAAALQREAIAREAAREAARGPATEPFGERRRKPGENNPSRPGRHFAKQPEVVDLTNDENDSTPSNPQVINIETIDDDEESRPSSKRSNEEEDGFPTKRSRVDTSETPFGFMDDLEQVLPEAPPQQYNPKGDHWYKQGVPSSQSQVPPTNSIPTPKTDEEEARQNYLEVLQFGKETSLMFYNRFSELENNLPPPGSLAMPQPTVSFDFKMEQLRAPMREMSLWFEKMMELNQQLQKNGQSL